MKRALITGITGLSIARGSATSLRILLAELTQKIADEFNIVLSSQIIEELQMVIEIKFPHKKFAFDRFMSKLSFEMAFTPTEKVYGKLYSQCRNIDCQFSKKLCQDFPKLL